MATIYISDEVANELDKQVKEHNETNPPTDRSGYLQHLLNNKRK